MNRSSYLIISTDIADMRIARKTDNESLDRFMGSAQARSIGVTPPFFYDENDQTCHN